MVDNVVTKPLGFILIISAHMVFNGPSQAEITGILGTNITLQFTFNISNMTKDINFGVYKNKTKIAEYPKHKGGRLFDVYPKNTTVFYHITNLKLNHSDCYFASLYSVSTLPLESNRVKLIVQQENRSSTVPPMQSDIPKTTDSGTSSNFVTVLVVSPVVLLAAVLPCLIWCLMRSKDKEQSPRQSSNPTVQETVEASSNVPAPSLIYSVLDFPKRPQAVLEINPCDTEYAAVSYLTEKSVMSN